MVTKSESTLKTAKAAKVGKPGKTIEKSEKSEKKEKAASAPAAAVGFSLKELKKLKAQKNLLLGDRSKGVVLLQNDIVVKSYDRHNKQQVQRFDKEVAILQRLQGCKYVPKLYDVDHRKKRLYMQFVGKNPSQPFTQQIKDEVQKALLLFGEKYHVFRVKNGKAKFTHKDLFPLNVCEHNGQVYLIDFGSGLWQIHDHSFAKYISHSST
jgi:serine/threonine-protein kinase RIO1